MLDLSTEYKKMQSKIKCNQESTAKRMLYRAQQTQNKLPEIVMNKNN